ncbi:MAG: hypothetical protein ACREP8_04510, partial [Candidatus Binatia bacterium]
MVMAIPGGNPGELAEIPGLIVKAGLLENPADRLDAYQKVQSKIDGHALVRSIRAQKAMYQSMANEVGTTDTVLQYILPGDDVDCKNDFLAQIKTLENIERLVTSADPAEVEEGRKLFLEWQQAGYRKGEQDTYETSAKYNSYCVGAAIVVAAALTAGIGGGFVAALGGGTLVKGLTVAVVFTLSTRVYTAAIYDGVTVGDAFRNIYNDPLGFGEEVLINWLMFGTINKANSVFMGYFNKGVETVAIRNLVAKGLSTETTRGLVAKGLLADGAMMTERMIAKNPALKQALAAELGAEVMLVRNGIFTAALGGLGRFATEVMAFQVFEVGTG